ncbi:MAG TPA: esterase-like activity of phytase family protein [Pseudolabrys sp.]|nr:esterase-like activity of phytase family protein [Pseudolabrys sp.]
MTRRRWLIAGSLFAAAAVAVATLAIGETLRFAAVPTPIAIEATTITSFDNRDPTRVRFGALEFRGGLSLTAKHDAFGGISALHMEPDGSHFLAATDRGSWLKGRIVYQDGKPAGIADAELAPILGADGKPLATHGWFDVESLTEREGLFYIGIERVERIVRFDIRRDGLKARGEPIPVPADFKTLKRNKSLECLATAPKGGPHGGDLIAVTEESLDAAGNHRAFVLPVDGGDVERFSVKRSDDFDVSDCTVLPPGDLLILERHYSPARGVAMRIRRLPLKAIAPGKLVDGQALITADLAYQIDNMEGIAVTRNSAGETVLTLVSDDNFSVLQRSLLLQFTLVE